MLLSARWEYITSIMKLVPVLDAEGEFTHPMSEEDRVKMDIWIKEVVHPSNLKMEEIILNNSELIEDAVFPEILFNTIKYINEYKIRLEECKFQRCPAFVDLLDTDYELKKYVEMNYYRLKSKQLQLLGVPHKPIEERARHAKSRYLDMLRYKSIVTRAD